jgi:hypothetical protein
VFYLLNKNIQLNPPPKKMHPIQVLEYKWYVEALAAMESPCKCTQGSRSLSGGRKHH